MDQDLVAYLAAMEQRLEQRFDAMEKHSGAIEQRFDAMEKRSDAMDQRFDAMEKRSDATEQRFDVMETRVTQQIQGLRQEMVERFEKLETEVREVHIVAEDIQDKIQLAAEGIMNVNEKLDRHRDEVSGRFNDLESLVRDSDRAVVSRVDRLEQKLKIA